jgi:hypothetical protein
VDRRPTKQRYPSGSNDQLAAPVLGYRGKTSSPRTTRELSARQ